MSVVFTDLKARGVIRWRLNIKPLNKQTDPQQEGGGVQVLSTTIEKKKEQPAFASVVDLEDAACEILHKNLYCADENISWI